MVEVAAILCVERSTIRNWENGTVRMPFYAWEYLKSQLQPSATPAPTPRGPGAQLKRAKLLIAAAEATRKKRKTRKKQQVHSQELQNLLSP